MEITENQVIRFISITRKKAGLFVNFKAKGVKNGTVFTSSITVDLSAADVTPADSMEKIIECCAKTAIREFKKADLQLEPISII